MTPKVLLVSYHFPPENNSAAIRMERMVSELVDDFEVHVLTKSSKNEELDSDLHSDVKIHRSLEYTPFSPSTYHPFWLLSAIPTIHNLFREWDFDVMWSRYTPAASHLVALSAKLVYDIPWVTYFGDPWIGSPYRRNNWEDVELLERKIVENADCLTFSNGRQVQWYTNRYGISEDSCKVVRNFVNPAEIESLSKLEAADEEFHIVHIGNLYGIRSPASFLEAVADLPKEVQSNLFIEFIGNTSDFKNLFDSYEDIDAIQMTGRLPKSEAIRRAKGADALLLIDAPVRPSPYLPMKLVEYLHMDLPILGLTPQNGTSSDVIRESGTGIVASPDDAPEISDALLRLVGGPEDQYSVNEDYLERFTAEHAISELKKALRDAANQ